MCAGSVLIRLSAMETWGVLRINEDIGGCWSAMEVQVVDGGLVRCDVEAVQYSSVKAGC